MILNLWTNFEFSSLWNYHFTLYALKCKKVKLMVAKWGVNTEVKEWNFVGRPGRTIWRISSSSMKTPTLTNLSPTFLIFCRYWVTELEFFLMLLSSRLRFTTLKREIDVYLLIITFHIPEVVVCPITKDMAESDSVELISENNVLSLVFHCK